MNDLTNIIFICASCIFLFVFIFMLSFLLFSFREKNKIKQNIKYSIGINKNKQIHILCTDGFANQILNDMLKTSYALKNSYEYDIFIKKIVKKNEFSHKLKNLCLQANMPQIFNRYAFCQSQLKYSFFGAVIGSVIGLIFSNMLMLILLIIGLIVGIYLPYFALKKEKFARINSLEKNLPEMIDVVALGMRSGLTFDRALDVYVSYFDNELSRNFSQAKIKWDGTICSRDEALRQMANSYDSFLFSRLIENIIRSIRFGSSLVDNLEQTAHEARNIYKEKQEEIVSKAPVKMMVPTGTLILPAMLIFVLGPVILQLISGF